jgi:general secretion pathway protein E
MNQQRSEKQKADEQVIEELNLKSLLKLLHREGLLDEQQVKTVRRRASSVRSELNQQKEQNRGAGTAKRERTNPVEILSHFNFKVEDRPLDADLITKVIARDAGLPFEKPDPLELNMELVSDVLSQPFARHHACVPLRREEGEITFAVADPYDKQLQYQLRSFVDGDPKIVVSPFPDIQQLITEVFGLTSSVFAAEKEAKDEFEVGNLEQLVELKSVENLEATDQPVVNAVEYLLRYAFEQRASDLHIEPKRDQSHVRLRIDGVLHDIYQFPKQIHRAVVSRIKMLARMDISEKRRPQDGRIKTQRKNQEVELRVSSLPVAFGEKIVIRVFDPESAITDLSTLGLTSHELETWEDFISHPRGLILVTGPTGSGKTTTLYSTLKKLADSKQNITTIEDPIEMVQDDFNQVLVQPDIDVTFSSALRHVLRQDPDVIMVGEIRDAETAQMATQAALTGHLVFSTLHTNDTSSTISRMLDLNVKPFLLASTLIGIVAQRLVRRICDMCKETTHLSEKQLTSLDIKLPPRTDRELPVKYGTGCSKCRGTGYFSRTGVFEFLEVDDNVRRLIQQRAEAKKIRQAARAEGMRSLQESAVRKLAKGETTFEEVMKIYSDH